MSNDPQAHRMRHPTPKQYIVVATFLAIITAIEVWIIYVDALDDVVTPILIFLSAIKFAAVVMFYMHLKFDSPLFTGVFVGGLVLAFAVILAVLGLFTALHVDAKPREFARENAVAYEGHGEGGTAEVKVAIGSIGDEQKFDKAKFTVSAGGEVVLAFTNNSTVFEHNWVLVQPGTKDEVAAEGAAAGPANGWIPADDPRIIASTGLLAPAEAQEVQFTAPEAGTYQFVCTFPGHAVTMFGDFEVTP